MERNKVKKECYLITQANTTHKCLIKFFFLRIEHDKSKLQKQISKLLILNATAA